MAYYGYKPAEQAIQIGDNTIVSADIADGSIVNDDLNSSAAIAMSKTQFVAGTGLTLSTNTLNLDTITSAASLVTVGTIGTGVWQGTAVASAYLDADTAHLSGTQTFTGAKSFSSNVTLSKDGQAVSTINSNDDAAELKLTSFYSGSARTWSLFSDNTADAFLISDGTTRFTLTDTSATFSGNLIINHDGTNSLRIGASADLQLYHNGTDSVISNGLGGSNNGKLYLWNYGSGNTVVGSNDVESIVCDGANAIFRGTGTFAGDVKIENGATGCDKISYARFEVGGSGSSNALQINGPDEGNQYIFFSNPTDEGGNYIRWLTSATHNNSLCAFTVGNSVELTLTNASATFGGQVQIDNGINIKGYTTTVTTLTDGTITDSTFDAIELDGNAMYEVTYVSQNYDSGQNTGGWRYVRWHLYDGSGGQNDNAGANFFAEVQESSGANESSDTPTWSNVGVNARITYGNGYATVRRLIVKSLAGTSKAL